MPRVVHFELSVDDAERAAAFYKEVFGWEFHKWDGPFDYWGIRTGAEGQPGIDGGLMLRQEGISGTVNTVDVASVDESVEQITRNGGKVVTPKMAIPGIGYMAYVADTEGNIFGIMQDDPSAQA